MINNLSRRYERIQTSIYSSSEAGSLQIAREIRQLIEERQAEGKNAVLGLATGSSPIRVYQELVRMHEEESLSFRNVITFNLDEYSPIDPRSLQSYNRFMNEHLFDHIDINRNNVYIPDGTLPLDRVEAYCQEYEQKIAACGGIDIQLLGIGRTGHIGFNEPGSAIDSVTRLIALDTITRIDAASDFFGKNNVPRTAITMGISTIMKSWKIFLMAWGEGKAAVIRKTVEGEVTELIPATFLQKHKNVCIALDDASSSELTQVKTPWLTRPVEWDNKLIRRAVVWLCSQVSKPILKLTDEDYNEHGMNELLTIYGSGYKINIKVFNELQHTITGWPGGKPDADDSQRPERAKPFPKRVLIFSPHPDDDVISMGGTFLRLVEQGHEVHVGYQTSGNIAVFDDYAFRFLEFAKDLNEAFSRENDGLTHAYREIDRFLRNKKPGESDHPHLQLIKGLVRRNEAKAACRFFGVSYANIHFMDLPFYETGTVKKKPIGREDIDITKKLITSIKPHQIYAAGDLSDPHGTHRVCLQSVFAAVDELKTEKWMNDCRLWLYRGAWQEWGVEDVEMAVPISPEELLRKRKSIFKHESQKDTALFPGNDSREFWQRAEDRNRETARLYDRLGLAEYEAIEGFVEWKF